MSKRRYFKPEEIISKLREAEVFLGKGLTTGQACRKIGVSQNTYYKWRKEYGGIEQVDRALYLERNSGAYKV
jgi:transposase-like protein